MFHLNYKFCSKFRDIYQLHQFAHSLLLRIKVVLNILGVTLGKNLLSELCQWIFKVSSVAHSGQEALLRKGRTYKQGM